MNNSAAWSNIYETSDFGNLYPSSYLVSLFHSRIKPLLLQKNNLQDVNILDFGCSIGANSVVFQNLQMNTYGIDVSVKAIERLHSNKIGDNEHFKAANLLDSELEIDDIFPGVKFDCIIASEIMYYFKDAERTMILNKFSKAMNKDAIIYVSMPSYDMALYNAYKEVPKDENGMVEVKESGRIKDTLWVNLPRTIEDVSKMFKPFKTIDILTTNLPVRSNENMIEYHLIAQL